MSIRKKPGPLLAWHGNRIRVVVQVPPSLRAVLGCSKLREALPTSDPLLARCMAIPVVARFKAIIADAAAGDRRGAEGLLQEALHWRRASVEEADQGDRGPEFPSIIGSLVKDRHRELVRQHGEEAASIFIEVAAGRATPLSAFMDT